MVDTYADWLDGPFQWPPLDRTAMGSCPSGEASIRILTSAFVTLRDHLRNPRPVPKYDHQRVNATFPVFHRHNFSADPSGPVNATDAMVATYNPLVGLFAGLIKTLLTGVIGIDMSYIIGFFTGGLNPDDNGMTIATLAKSMLKCDFKSVIDCQKKRVNTLSGALAVCLLMAILYISFGAMTALVLSGVGILPLILWYVYGYSPTCIPMVPECAVQDVLDSVGWLIPIQLTWPAALQRIPGCALNPDIPYRDCFIPCAADPFRYARLTTPPSLSLLLLLL